MKRKPLRRQQKKAAIVKKPQTEMVVRAPNRQPWLLSPTEVTLLKNSVCKGASDAEMEFCLAVARRYELDPFKKQIHFVPRWDKQAEASDGERGSRVWIPIVGIDGLQHIAARDHKDYGSFSEPEYGPMIAVDYQWNGKGPTKQIQAPEWARVEAWKKGDTRATVGKVWWKEIYPNVNFSPTVREKPRLMLAKCARAQAIRASYPSTGGLLIEEETHTREFENFTPAGRLISDAPPAEQRFLDREKEQMDMIRNTAAGMGMPAEKLTTPTSLATSVIDLQPANPPLQWKWDDARHIGVVFGITSVMERAKAILDTNTRLVNGKRMVNADQLEALKFVLPKAGFPFEQVKADA